MFLVMDRIEMEQDFVMPRGQILVYLTSPSLKRNDPGLFSMVSDSLEIAKKSAMFTGGSYRNVTKDPRTLLPADWIHRALRITEIEGYEVLNRVEPSIVCKNNPEKQIRFYDEKGLSNQSLHRYNEHCAVFSDYGRERITTMELVRISMCLQKGFERFLGYEMRSDVVYVIDAEDYGSYSSR